MLADLMPVCSFLCELVLVLQTHRLAPVPLLSKPAIEFSSSDRFLDAVDGLLDFITPLQCYEQSQLGISTVGCIYHMHHLRAKRGSLKHESRFERVKLTSGRT